MNDKFSAFQYVGEFCLMRKCDEQDYRVVEIDKVENGVIKYFNVDILSRINESKNNYVSQSIAHFIDESFAVVKPLF